MNYAIMKRVTVNGKPVERILTVDGDFVDSRFVNIWEHRPKTWKTISGAQRNAERYAGAEVAVVTSSGFKDLQAVGQQ